MNYELIELQLSGQACKFYTIIEEGHEISVFENFLTSNQLSNKEEAKEIVTRIKAMANSIGAKRNFFKEFEGNFGDKVCALFDMPEQKMRLYCIRYSNDIVILGGGGPKLAGVKAYQAVENLDSNAQIMKDVAFDIEEKLHLGKIKFSTDRKSLIGDFKFKK